MNLYKSEERLLLISAYCIKLSIMIKLLLITLLCATLVFGSPLVQNFRDVGEKPVSGYVNRGDHFVSHSSLVRRSTLGRGGVGGGWNAGAGIGFGWEAGAGVGGGVGGGYGK